MSESNKKIISICSVMIAIVIVLLIILSYFEKIQPKDVVYPGSGLSSSIFDMQNTNYKKTDAFPNAYALTNIPYYIDLPTADQVQIQSGICEKIRQNLFLYVTEFAYTEDINNVIIEQLSPVLLLDCDTSSSLLETVKEEMGYKNGYGVIYDIKKFRVTNNVNSKDAVIMSYYIELPDQEEDVLLATVSLSETNENLRLQKDMLDALLNTFRYDEKLLKKIDKREKDEEKAADAERRAEEKRIAEEEAAAIAQQKAEQEAIENATKTSDVELVLDAYYKKLSITINWDKKATVDEIKIISPDEYSYSPVLQNDTSATFEINDAYRGTWLCRITGSNLEDVDIVMEEIETTSGTYDYDTETDDDYSYDPSDNSYNETVRNTPSSTQEEIADRYSALENYKKSNAGTPNTLNDGDTLDSDDGEQTDDMSSGADFVQ